MGPSYIYPDRNFNSLRPRQNGRYFTDDTSKRFFQNENVWISIKISLKLVPKAPINNIPSLVQIMAWRRPGDKSLSETMMVSLLTHICVTRSQWDIDPILSLRIDVQSTSFWGSLLSGAWSLIIEGILPKGPYLPCLRMADRALLAGYPRICLYLGATTVRTFAILHVHHVYAA